MAELYERPDGQRESFWERPLLDSEIARDVFDAYRVSGLRQVGWEHLHRLSEMAEASDPGCLLRRDGAESGTVQTDECADPDDHGRLRRRSARCVYVLQAPHGIRDGRSEGESLPDYWTVGPRGNTNTEGGGGRAEIWQGESRRPEHVTHGMV